MTLPGDRKNALRVQLGKFITKRFQWGLPRWWSMNRVFSTRWNTTRKVYQRVVMTVMKSWMMCLLKGSLYVFQQDDGSDDISYLMQSWLDDDFDVFWPKHFLQPNTPALNHLDFFLKNVGEWGFGSRRPNTSSLCKPPFFVCVWEFTTFLKLTATPRVGENDLPKVIVLGDQIGTINIAS